MTFDLCALHTFLATEILRNMHTCLLLNIAICKVCVNDNFHSEILYIKQNIADSGGIQYVN